MIPFRNWQKTGNESAGADAVRWCLRNWQLAKGALQNQSDENADLQSVGADEFYFASILPVWNRLVAKSGELWRKDET